MAHLTISVKWGNVNMCHNMFRLAEKDIVVTFENPKALLIIYPK